MPSTYPLLPSEVNGNNDKPPSSCPWPSPSIPHHNLARTSYDITSATTHPTLGYDYLQLILNARVYDVAIESPLIHAPRLSTRLASTILLKREDLQPVFSFKLRGAYNKLFHLSPAERETGVVAASAGNHAQGVALAAQKLGIQATICMPVFAPTIKVNNVKRLGSQVILEGNDFDEAKESMFRIAANRNLTIVPPFDDPYVIAGQGTVAMEILRQVRYERLDAIFVCCGGGGLLAGIAAYVKRVRPEIRIIGVNTVDSAAMTESLRNGKVTPLKQVGLFSDGSAVRQVGQETFRLVSKLVDDMVTVTTDEVCAAIRDVFEETRTIVEPAGSLSVAGCRKYLTNHPELQNGGVYACVLSGANANFDRLGFVAERNRIGDGREALLCVRIPERPGSFLDLHDKIHPRNITQFAYRYSDENVARIVVSFEIFNGKDEIDHIMNDIVSEASPSHAESQRMKPWSVDDLTNNELAKHHSKFLCNSRARPLENERFLNVEFPERPNALRHFLTTMPVGINCTLFHYRYHGGDVSRVLVGFQVAPSHDNDFTKFLVKLGFQCTEIRLDDPALTAFL